MSAPRPLASLRVSGAIQVTRRITLVQLFVTLAIAAVALVLGTIQAAGSVLIGGGVSTLVSFYFASKVFSVRLGAPATKIAQAFFVGETVKLLLTVILLSAAFLWLPVAPLPLLLAYIATLLAYWLALPFTFSASTASVRTP